MEITPQSIKKLRDDLDLTQEEMANRLGVTRVTIYNWELGHITNISARYRRKIKALAAELTGGVTQ